MLLLSFPHRAFLLNFHINMCLKLTTAEKNDFLIFENLGRGLDGCLGIKSY